MHPYQVEGPCGLLVVFALLQTSLQKPTSFTPEAGSRRRPGGHKWTQIFPLFLRLCKRDGGFVVTHIKAKTAHFAAATIW